MLANARASIKMLAFIITVSFYMLSSALVYPLTWWNRFKCRQILAQVISFYSKIGLRFLGIQVRGSLPSVEQSFIVCNHLSYLDVLIISSKIPSCFVTSLEIKRTPFLGQLCELGGCLYVDRQNRQNLSQEVTMLAQGLQAGLNICVFPEGTSTNGESVLRFKRPLFRAAVEAQAPVLALSLNYISLNNEPVKIGNRDYLFWYGEISFLPHLWSLLKQKTVLVELKVAGTLMNYQDPVTLSERTQELVAANYRPITGDSRLPLSPVSYPVLSP